MPRKAKIKDEASLKWWNDRIQKQLKKGQLAEEYKKMERRAIKPGSLVTYNYRAKGESTLLFWDKKPITIIFSDTGKYFTSLNLHYVPPKFREILLSKIILINRFQIRNDKRFKLEWNDLQLFIKRNGLEISIRKYIKGRMSSIDYVKGSEWKYVSSLPSEKFVFNGDMDADQLYRMIYSHAKKTKSSKNRRYKR